MIESSSYDVVVAKNTSRLQVENLERKVELAREPIKAFVGQNMPFPESDISLPDEVVGALVATAAEKLAGHIMELLPVR